MVLTFSVRDDVRKASCTPKRRESTWNQATTATSDILPNSLPNLTNRSSDAVHSELLVKQSLYFGGDLHVSSDAGSLSLAVRVKWPFLVIPFHDVLQIAIPNA